MARTAIPFQDAKKATAPAGTLIGLQARRERIGCAGGTTTYVSNLDALVERLRHWTA
jgi:hypothetical protein